MLNSLLPPGLGSDSTPTRPVDNVITTKGRNLNINILDGTTVENKGKLILTEIFPSVQKHDIFLILINYNNIAEFRTPCRLVTFSLEVFTFVYPLDLFMDQ